MAKQTFTTGQVLTAAQMTSLQQTAMGGGSTTAKTTSYVLVAADAGTVVQMNAAGATTITVNTALFSAGDTVQIQNVGAGVCTITAGTATVSTSSTLALSQYDGGSLYFTATGAAIYFAWDAADNASPTSYGYTAGKNRIINGDFGVWQRGTSFALPSTTASLFSADRFIYLQDSGTSRVGTFSQQTFTPGTAPVAGYEGQFFLRYNCTTAGSGSTYQTLYQAIEDVRTLAGQTAIFSFWAKASSTVSVTNKFYQNFGSGGSANVFTTLQTISLTTSWTRYTVSATVPSVSGKTIGTGSFLATTFEMPLNAVAQIDLWGVQLEAGSTATAFQTATGTIQGELAACQRYLPAIGAFNFSNGGFANSTTRTFAQWKFPVTARVAPTGITTPAVSNFLVFNASTVSGNATAVTFDTAGTETADIYFDTTAGSPTLVLGYGGMVKVNTSGYILFTGCEL